LTQPLRLRLPLLAIPLPLATRPSLPTLRLPR
jgi:hypothetical protein